MKAFWLGLAALGPLAGATVTGYSREGNRVLLKLDDGAAAVEWISNSVFRLTRKWDGAIEPSSGSAAGDASIAVSDAGQAVRFSSDHIVLLVRKQGLQATVTDLAGRPLMGDLSEAARRGGGVEWEREAPPEVRYYGLGAREEGPLNLRGRRVEASKPFLLSSAGYGELHAAKGQYRFDLAASRSGRYRIRAEGADRVDYYFIYGPTPKETLEEMRKIEGSVSRIGPRHYAPLEPGGLPGGALLPPKVPSSWEGLARLVRWFVHAGMSGELLAAFDLRPFLDAPAPLRDRASQLASIAPLLVSPRQPGELREKLAAFFATYGEEAKDRGLPFWHPMPLQFPKDPKAAALDDQFLLGDEMIAAPVLSAKPARRLYLPQGIWTRLATNEVYTGRQEVAIEAAAGELPLFARNGTIVPLGDNPMELHYFPRLGAEFFLWEADVGDYSQVHAAPANDLLRLEIESKKNRAYEWIVHHTAKPRSVMRGDRELPDGTWSWDPGTRNLRIRVWAAQGEDHILRIVADRNP
jgi:hypothetical protein